MQNINISSNLIEVFPSARRASNSSRLFTEQAFTRIINQLTGKDSFIIQYIPSNSTNNDNDGSLIELNIKGYYFKIINIDSIIKNNINNFEGSESIQIFATIELETYDENGDSSSTYSNIPSNHFQELVGQDIDGKYEGLYLSNIKSEASNKYSLKLFDLSHDGTITPCSESYVMYVSGNVEIPEIFGGEIE